MRPNATSNSALIAAFQLALILAAPVLGGDKSTVDGVLEKYVEAIHVPGQEIELRMKVKEVKHNEKFEDSIFSKPSD